LSALAKRRQSGKDGGVFIACGPPTNLIGLMSRRIVRMREQNPMEAIAAATAKPKASKPITTKHLAGTLADQHQLTKKQGQQMIEDLIGLITKHLKRGERVKIAGLGILQVRKRAARMGRNPATGEPIHIKARRKVAFRATKELKEAI
jgi:DNA-binding protein HU-beta